MALVLAGLVAAALLTFMDKSGTSGCYVETKKQLETIRDAIERFAMKHDRFPLPARRNVGVEDVTYGREVAQSEINGNLDKVNNGPPDNTVAVFGALPFQALGIPVQNASDCWGNKLTYVVTQSLTEPKDGSGNNAFLNPDTKGAIDIKTDNSIMFLKGAGYAIISHGADALGAVKNNYRGSDRKWCAANAQLRTQNCDVENRVLISAEFNDGKNDAGKLFDDVIVYRGPPWRAAPVHGVCGAAVNLCDKGTPTGYINPGPCGGSHAWTCQGQNGGTDAPCAIANTPCGPPPPPPPPMCPVGQNTACGSGAWPPTPANYLNQCTNGAAVTGSTTYMYGCPNGIPVLTYRWSCVPTDSNCSTVTCDMYWDLRSNCETPS